jgi:hypothetical protein
LREGKVEACNNCGKEFEVGEQVISVAMATVTLDYIKKMDGITFPYDKIDATSSLYIFCMDCWNKIRDRVGDPKLGDKIDAAWDMYHGLDLEREAEIASEAMMDLFDPEEGSVYHAMMTLADSWTDPEILMEIFAGAAKGKSRESFKKLMVNAGADPDQFCEVCGVYKPSMKCKHERRGLPTKEGGK